MARLLVVMLTAFAGIGAGGLDIESRYSPKNRERSPRRATSYIILHTTEGGGRGSLEKLRRYGEAHYMVDRDGKVYRIIHRNRIAFHAGRSMWRGTTNLDNVSIGIEIVGYHNKPITAKQKLALSELLRQLQSIYGIPDHRVLPHSMVAYGRPNRWHRVAHRGRKRCAMLLGRDDQRREIGLNAKPSHDPDVRAGRLKVADPYLESVLFSVTPRSSDEAEAAEENVIARGRSAWDIARENYNAATTTYTFPDGTVKRGNEIADWNRIPPGTRVRLDGEPAEHTSSLEQVQKIGRDGASAAEIAGAAVARDSTIYFMTDGRVKQGSEMSAAELAELPDGTGMLVGYVHGGVISSGRRAFDICGPRWNLPTTFYRLPDGTIRNGADIDEKSIPNRTMVFFQP